MAAPHKKVDRNNIYQEISKMIMQKENHEVEISSSELADKFGVQAATMDYHLNKLVESGLIIISPKRGRYNRKIYCLPETEKFEGKAEEKLATEIVTPESADKFKKFLEEHIKKSKSAIEANKANEVNEVQEELNLEDESPTPDIPQEPVLKQEEPVPLQVKELSLDDRIKQFLKEAHQVHDAQVLLKHEDKEILSVMNETIQQTTVYLKDLSEQLSTVQNKQLIQHLIDDRNRMQQQMERLEQEAQEARSQVDQTIEKYEVNPTRVRFMHQMIIATIDDYVNRPNHAMALGRAEFRSKVSKEVSDLVKYVLHLEE